MRVAVCTASLVLLCAIGGCSPTKSSAGRRATIGPHGGFAVKLPGDIGFGEVVIELAVAEQRKDPKSQVVVYFLGPDLTTPLKLQPTNVSVHLLFPDAGPQTFTLSTQPRSDDPAGAGRFASQPAPLPIDEPLGELIAVFGAETFRAPISSVR